MIKVGSVISQDDKLYVITEINNHFPKMERLEDFVSRHVIIEYDGEHRTLQEIIDIHCDIYLAGKEIIR
jgi:hypothetical protein